ncbi:hypothetical protein L2E82_15312 [Cichorium intybus]|uniref:Uncharacterized protein n=1 Tax=Cichorium intybus TaxID=13427 RepID=A0ACB9F3Q9_CICIN|nr:hypothetical protein L2E82_15312 [Cichorium intybus]
MDKSLSVVVLIGEVVEVRFAMRDDRFAGYGHVISLPPRQLKSKGKGCICSCQQFWLEEDDDVMAPGETAQPGFHFGTGDVSVPSGGFNFN